MIIPIVSIYGHFYGYYKLIYNYGHFNITVGKLVKCYHIFYHIMHYDHILVQFENYGHFLYKKVTIFLIYGDLGCDHIIKSDHIAYI